jgi:hypothetical protein
MIGKFTSLPWAIQCIQGKQMTIGPELFKKYGDVVRIGEKEALKPSTLVDISLGPADIMFADKASIQKILVEEDFRKSRDYEAVREDPNITSLITETDKVKYKQQVGLLVSHRGDLY